MNCERFKNEKLRFGKSLFLVCAFDIGIVHGLKETRTIKQSSVILAAEYNGQGLMKLFGTQFAKTTLKNPLSVGPNKKTEKVER
jgi:hypothetical protein